jgi:hypothetical protein
LLSLSFSALALPSYLTSWIQPDRREPPCRQWVSRTLISVGKLLPDLEAQRAFNEISEPFGDLAALGGDVLLKGISDVFRVIS